MFGPFEEEYAQSVFEVTRLAHTRRWRSVLAVEVRFADRGAGNLDDRHRELERICSHFTEQLLKKVKAVGAESPEYLSTLQLIEGGFAFFFAIQPPVGIHRSIFVTMIRDSWLHCSDHIEYLAINNDATPDWAAQIGGAG